MVELGSRAMEMPAPSLDRLSTQTPAPAPPLGTLHLSWSGFWIFLDTEKLLQKRILEC